MEERIAHLIKAAEALIEDAELIDGYSYGQLVSPTLLDELRTAIEAAKGDKHGNKVAREGCDRCYCGSKYWEDDHCIDCGISIQEVKREDHV